MYDQKKPSQPSCEGPQFSDSPSGGIVSSDNYLGVSYDKHNHELPEDRNMHTESTAGEGAFNFSGNQYATDFKSYGVAVNAPDNSQRISVDTSRADRGKEA